MYRSHEGSICGLKHFVNNSNEMMLLTHVDCSILYECVQTQQGVPYYQQSRYSDINTLM